MAIPPRVDWYVWRIRTSEHLGHPSFDEMEREWSHNDLLDAHDILDAFDEAQQ